MNESEMMAAALLARVYQGCINRDCTSARTKLAEAQTKIETLALTGAETIELKIRILEVEMFLSVCCDYSVVSAIDSILNFLHAEEVGMDRKLSEVELSLRELRRRLVQMER